MKTLEVLNISEFKVGQKFIFNGFHDLPDNLAEIIGFTKTQIKFRLISTDQNNFPDAYVQHAKIRVDEKGMYVKPYNRFTIRPHDRLMK